jgi:hypothetical protein
MEIKNQLLILEHCSLVVLSFPKILSPKSSFAFSTLKHQSEPAQQELIVTLAAISNFWVNEEVVKTLFTLSRHDESWKISTEAFTVSAIKTSRLMMCFDRLMRELMRNFLMSSRGQVRQG